jgi:AraC family transcriptional regulator of adaptative response/methylated-DNA-[protein]-cysteine methyltransferase
MENLNLTQSTEDYRRVAAAITYLEKHFQEQPSLDELAAQVHLSPYHFHRLFKRWAGITPKQFLQYLTIDYAKQRLAHTGSILETSYDAGLSGPGRLHDLFITFEAITPGQYKAQGQGVEIYYGFHPTPFGDCLLAMTDRGVCTLAFVEDGQQDTTLAQLRQDWPQAAVIPNSAATGVVVGRIFSPAPAGKPLHLLVKGTNFQVKVWEALLAIPPGAVVSYGAVATTIGHPTAARAVGSTIGRNPIGYIIPCHRVIRGVGAVSSYRWGATRKKALLAWEAGQVAA